MSVRIFSVEHPMGPAIFFSHPERRSYYFGLEVSVLSCNELAVPLNLGLQVKFILVVYFLMIMS
jgi:hypothetical protein